jgi:predicted AlkP superfamily phosphohydrolase/phosphomutase
VSARAAAAALLAVSIAACGSGADGPPPVKPAYPRGLVVLGIDGMDPAITRRLLAEGQLPNLAALIASGGMSELDTTDPPQSPVAWSTIITGLGSEGHGIYDFVHRDLATLGPMLSTARTTEPDYAFDIGPWTFTLDSGKTELLREGAAFWQTLEQHGVPATVVKIPANFPPAASTTAESSSGMGTPDLIGSYGTYQLVTDDPALAKRPFNAGIAHLIDFGSGQRAAVALSGPPSPTSSEGETMTVDLEVVRDREQPVALLRLDGNEVMLKAGEWSDWLPVHFDPGIFGGAVPGMVRLYLRSTRPFHLYVSPINVDPLDPAMALSAPERYATDLAKDVGRYYTQGMPEDTKALASGALSPAEFLTIADHVMTETEAALARELARFRGGFLFVYLSSIDLTSHMFFRSLDPDADAADRANADAIPALYRRVDGWIATVQKSVPPGTRLVIMSDHGFAPYTTKVNLNTFLAHHGYLAQLPAGQRQPGPLGDIDWSHTTAYALGLNQVFLNEQGRERHGIVAPADRERVLAQLSNDLLAFTNPETGETVVTHLGRPVPGHFDDRAPDLIVGYRRTYRSSDESALGAITDRELEPNHDAWSGDHCMDPSAVPGVIAVNAQLDLGGVRPQLRDITPTILHFFGIQPPADVVGRALLTPPR